VPNLWDYFEEGEEPSGPSGYAPSARRPIDYPSRTEAPAPPRKAGKKDWAEGGPGVFEWQGEGEIDPKIDRLVMGWIRENPNYIQDILTGMYGLAGSNEQLQAKVLSAREAAMDAGESYATRKDPKGIGRKIETYLPSQENFVAFKQALLNEFPNLIKKERKSEAYEKADLWIRVADQVFAL
jgi:hypothetical protein